MKNLLRPLGLAFGLACLFVSTNLSAQGVGVLQTDSVVVKSFKNQGAFSTTQNYAANDVVNTGGTTLYYAPTAIAASTTAPPGGAWVILGGGSSGTGGTVTINGVSCATGGTCSLSPSAVGADAAGAASAAQAAAIASSLQKSQNLSDLASASAARASLGLGSAATMSGAAFDAAGLAAAAQAAAEAASDPMGAAAAAQSAAVASSLQKSSNLSDLASASGARASLGLGTAAVKSMVGSGTGGPPTTPSTPIPSGHGFVSDGAGGAADMGYTPAAVGTVGQLPVSQGAGVGYAPQTLSGDCTITSTGVETCLPNMQIASAAIAANVMVSEDPANVGKYTVSALGKCGSPASAAAASGATFRVLDPIGSWPLTSDTAVTGGNLLIPSTTNAGHVQDSGTTDRTTISLETDVCGKALQTISSAGTVTTEPLGRGTRGLKVDTINGSPAGAAQTFLGAFPSSVQNVFMLTEGSGTTVTDAKAGATASVVSGGTVTWTADKALSFSGGSTNRWAATSVTSMQGLEACFVPSYPTTSQQFNMPVGYTGNASSSNPGIFIEMGYYWAYNANTATVVLNYPSYAGYKNYNGSTNDVFSATSLASGQLYCVTLSAPSAGAAALYVNGIPVSNISATPTLSTFAGNFLEFGGTFINNSAVCTGTYCGFNGKIYSVVTYSTAPTAAQVAQSYRAELQVLQAKGVNINQTQPVNGGLGAQNAATQPVQIVGVGESITRGQGLTTPATQNYSYVSASTINGGNATGFALAQNSAAAYLMHQNFQLYSSLYSSIATNVIVLFSNANGCKETTSIPNFTTNIAQSEANSLIADAIAYRNAGFVPIIATGLSGAYPSQSVGDAGKDSCNPVIRSRALQTGIPLWDIASNPLFGADGSSNTYSSGTQCGGSACFQGDFIHPSVSAQAIMGANLAVLVNHVLYPAESSTTAATYTMTGKEAPLLTNPSSASQAITLIDCIGFTGQALQVVNTQTSGSNTVTVSPVSTYTTETINGASSYLVPNGGSVTFTAYNKGDAAGGCSWTAR